MTKHHPNHQFGPGMDTGEDGFPHGVRPQCAESSGATATLEMPVLACSGQPMTVYKEGPSDVNGVAVPGGLSPIEAQIARDYGISCVLADRQRGRG